MRHVKEIYRELLEKAHTPTPAPPESKNAQNGIQVLSGVFEEGQMVAIKETPFTDVCFPHSHDNIEISYLVSGKVNMTINNRSLAMLPGEFLVLDTNCVHCTELLTDDTLLLSINIRTSFFDEAFFKRFYRKDDITNFFAKSIYSGKKDRRYLYFSASRFSRIHDCIDNIVQEYFCPSVCSRELVEAYMMIFFTEMIRIRATSPQTTVYSERVGEAGLPQLSNIIDYMNANLEEVTRADVADNLGYSYSYVNKIIQETTGSSFVQLRRTLRLQRMERLLLTTSLPVAEIGKMSGFQNISSCYKLFRETYHMLPQAYREAYAQQISETKD